MLPFGFQHITKWNIIYWRFSWRLSFESKGLTTVPLYPVLFFPQEPIWLQVFATSVCNWYCYHANASCLVTWHSCENEGEYINYADMNGYICRPSLLISPRNLLIYDNKNLMVLRIGVLGSLPLSSSSSSLPSSSSSSSSSSFPSSSPSSISSSSFSSLP